MAATRSAFVGSVHRPTPTLKTENFDMDSFFDFNQGTPQPSPATASSSKLDITSNQDWSALSPFDQSEEQQSFNGPSHDYHQYKQQVGLPVGSMANMPSQHDIYGYNSGIDMGFNSSFDMNGYGSGIDMDSEMGMDMNAPMQQVPTMFFPPSRPESQGDNFVNPTTIGGQEEPASNVGRLWPGMHSQQAQQIAMQKAAAQQMMQQRQMKLLAQHRQRTASRQSEPYQAQQLVEQPSQSSSKKPSAPEIEPHVEESISRLLNQMRQNSTVSSDDAASPGGSFPHSARMRKDEEEMDEDERLLASDEGKKLSSKERRQLRNKVSARAFRSRRKEYISQLEGEVAVKVQEASTLRSENNTLAAENERYRGLIETLLRHQAFRPFIEDISNNPANLGQVNGMQMQPSQTAPLPAPTSVRQSVQPQAPQQEDIKSEYVNLDAHQMQQQQHQPEQRQRQQSTQHIGMTMIPEENFSKLNLNCFGNQAMDFNNYQSVNAYPVTDLPAGPHLTDAFFGDIYGATETPMDMLLAKLENAASRMS